MIIKGDDQNFVNHPEGIYQAVCIDIVELGEQPTKWGKRPKVKVVWETTEIIPEKNKPFIISNNYNVSLNNRASLRKMLEGWRGAKFSDEQLKEGFDMEKLIGLNCQLQVVINADEDNKEWANVSAVVPLSKGMENMVSTGGYVRVQNRPIKGASNESDAPQF